MKKACLLAVLGLMATSPAMFGACGDQSNYQAPNNQDNRMMRDNRYATNDTRAMNETRSATAVVLSDSQIKDNVKDALQNSDVSVSVDSGVVTLKGEVGSTQMKNDIENRVSSMDGVKRVDNQLKTSNKTSY